MSDIKTNNSGRKRGAKLRVLLLLLAVAAILTGGWQLWSRAKETRVSDAQAQMKPVQDTAQEPVAIDFTDLQAQNPDIIGWITIAPLGIDYPIVQGTDNSYYLKHTAQRSPNRMGALFLDFRVKRDFSDFNSVVYGHYTKSGKMFGSLKQMKEQAFFNRVIEGQLYTPEGTSRLEIFAVVLTSADSAFYDYIFPGPESQQAHLDRIRKQAMQYRDIGAAPGDRLLVLSTCSYEFNAARTLVIARISDTPHP